MNYGDSYEKSGQHPTTPQTGKNAEPCNLGEVLEENNKNVLRWREGLPSSPDNSNLDPILSLLTALQYDKEKTYGSSWKGKGEIRGIMANIDRKYDRIDKITDDEIQGKRKTLPKDEFNELTEAQLQEIGESKIDAVADLANYCLLYMTYLRDTYPGAFEHWVRRNIPPYMMERLGL